MIIAKCSFTLCSNSPLQRTVLEDFFLGGSMTDSRRTPVPGAASRRFSICRNYRGRIYVVRLFGLSEYERKSSSIIIRYFGLYFITFMKWQFDLKTIPGVLTAALDWAKLFHAFVSSDKENTIHYSRWYSTSCYVNKSYNISTLWISELKQNYHENTIPTFE